MVDHETEIDWSKVGRNVSAIAITPDGRRIMLPNNYSPREIYKYYGTDTTIIDRPSRENATPDWSEAPDDVPRNKYDREIIGKYGTGKCIVDVYRVLNAFGPLPPEIQHAIKKLAAPGKRGVKDEKQDLLEAIQSIEARLQYLEACDD